MTQPKHSARVLAAIAAVITAMPVLSLPDIPVYVKEPVPPNILLTIDDSTSMANGYIPDSIEDLRGANRFLAASFNPIQYNPSTVYRQPPRADGSRYSTSFTAAWHDGFLRINNAPVDLSRNYRPTFSYFPGNVSADFIGARQPAYYYVYDTRINTCTSPNPDDDSCYRKVIVGPQEQQNFANWYSFYRTRNLMLRSALLLALDEMDLELRFAWQALNSCGGGWTGQDCTDVLGNRYANGMNALKSGSHRANLFNWVAGIPAFPGTPLRSAFVRAGEYFQRTDNSSPYRDVPGTPSARNACRLSYHVALTDGIWNTDNVTVPASNSDHGAGSLPDNVSYRPMPPFASSFANNLADLAFAHWRTDLQPSMANTVPPFSASGNSAATSTWSQAEYWNPQNNPATWQHLVTYTVGLGLSRSLTNPRWMGTTYASDSRGDGYAKFASGEASWPATGPNTEPGNVYDLWHAAINGRGEFFSAETPDDVYRAFQSILARISALAGSTGAVATTSAYAFSNSIAYQSQFSSTNWTGKVVAKRVDRFGRVGSDLWTTDNTFASLTHRNRNLYTRATRTAANLSPVVIPFKWESMDAATRATFKSEEIVAWLAGDQSREQGNPDCLANCVFRRRTKLLGDILGSSVVVSADQDFGYKDATWPGGGDAYRAYLTRKAARTPIVLVGANDGFVHGLDGNSGTELFGYAPGEITNKMWRLSEQVYVKKAFVDGQISVGDAFIAGQWGTYAVGALGAGAKSVYALNISEPNGFGAAHVLWEFTHPKMGHVLSKPIIARLPNGTWAAIFSGGYENDDHSAVLFTVDLRTGNLLSILEASKSTDACGRSVTSNERNGLGAPRAFTGKEGEFFVYAGDLRGHLWRFEYESRLGRMIVSYGQQPLFKACNGASIAQPITAQPTVSALGASPLVYVGTGRLFDAGDTSLATTNSFYAVIDDGVAHVANRSVLLSEQTVTAVNANVRTNSNNSVNLVAKRGWFFDLPALRERVLAPPVLLGERVVFTTFAPANSDCQSTGNSWLFEVDALSGAAFASTVLDVNGDGKFDAADRVQGKSVSAVAIDATVGGVTAIRTSDAAETGRGTPPPGGCRAGDIQLVSTGVYSPTTRQYCTPGATFRTGWRQLR